MDNTEGWKICNSELVLRFWVNVLTSRLPDKRVIIPSFFEKDKGYCYPLRLSVCQYSVLTNGPFLGTLNFPNFKFLKINNQVFTGHFVAVETRALIQSALNSMQSFPTT